MNDPMPCRLCSQVALAIWYLPEGCIAYPEWKIQPLCWHHELKAQPRGGMELVLRLADPIEP